MTEKLSAVREKIEAKDLPLLVAVKHCVSQASGAEFSRSQVKVKEKNKREKPIRGILIIQQIYIVSSVSLK